MSNLNFQNLSRRERQIMELFFQKGNLTAQQLVELLPDQPSNATVRTLLRILEQKGHLTHSKSGRQFVYTTVTKHDSASRNVFKDMLKTFFKGSISNAVATFINDPDTNMTDAELAELEEIVRKAKAKEENK
jgi:predicted transcriptional regulator